MKDGTSATFDLSAFNGETRVLARELLDIVHDLRTYWPLTVRQVYYRAVAALLLPNERKAYNRVSRVLTRLRRSEILSWFAIDDRTRRTISGPGTPNVREFIQGQMISFLDAQHYGRCYIQGQEAYVEILIEKDALAGVLEGTAYNFCTRLTPIRGQSSATIAHAIAERLDRAMTKGKTPIILYAGDLDPSGIQIPRSMKKTLLEHHGLDIEFKRIALNRDQVAEYGLPESLDAAKSEDPNYGKWIAEQGNKPPVELDAIHPRDLIALVEKALTDVYDMAEFSRQQKQEIEDRKEIKVIRQDVEDFCIGRWPEYFMPDELTEYL